MAKVSFANLKLKVSDEVKVIKVNDTEIEVKQYLSISDLYDIMMITLQNSKEDGYYNPYKISMYMHLYLLYAGTNLSFTDKQKEDEAKLYDILNSNGIIKDVCAEMPYYQSLVDSIENTITTIPT